MDHEQLHGLDEATVGARRRSVRPFLHALTGCGLRVRVVVALVGSLALLPPAGAVEPPQAPESADEVGRNPAEWGQALRENSWEIARARNYIREGQRLETAGQHDAAIAALEEATRIDSSHPAPHMGRARLDLRRFDPTALGEFIYGIGLAWSGYRHLARSAVQLWITIQLAVAIFFVWFLLHLSFRYLPFWHHQLKSRFDRQRHQRRAYGYLYIGLVAVLLALPSFGLVPAVAGLCIAIWPYTHRRAQLAIAILLLTFGLQAQFAIPSGALLARIDATSNASLIMAARDEPASPALLGRLERARAKDPGDEDLLFAEGLALARAGRFMESNERFVSVLEGRANDPLSTNNLACNHYYLGDVDRAVAGFQRAVTVDANRGALHHNLSQSYLRKLFMREGGESMERAIRLGFIASQQPLPLPNGAVYYAAPHDRELWRLAWRDRAILRPVHLIAPYGWLLGVPASHVGTWLLALVAVLPLLGRILPRPKLVYECANCKTLSCARCSGEHDGIVLCSSCVQHARRAKSEMVLATLLRNRRHGAENRSAERWSRWNLFFFGAGHLQDGMRRRGVVSALWLSTCVAVLWSPQLPGVSTFPVSQELLSPTRVAALAGLVLLFFISWIGRAPLRSVAFHIHPGSLISLGELIEGRPRRRASA